MGKIEEFKSFVKTKPSLIAYVKSGEMTWQKFYEIWDLYGPDHEEWNKYNDKQDNVVSVNSRKIDEFKAFVRTKPSLIAYVKSGEMTWQKFYEIWDLYGPDHEEWNKYSGSQEKSKESETKKEDNVSSTDKKEDSKTEKSEDKKDTKEDNKEKVEDSTDTSKDSKAESFGINDLFNMFKKIDLNSIKNNISGIQRAITLIQEMTAKDVAGAATKAPYTPRPMYRRFED